jgi:hypothetical protein
LAACDSPLDPELALALSQYLVEIRAVRGSTTPVSQTVQVSNTGGGRLGPVSCNPAPAPWLVCNVTGGNNVTLTANPAGLTQSPSPATVELTAPGASTATSVVVDFRIDQPVITLSAGTLAFTATEGSGGTTPSQGSITVTNTGAGTLADLGAISCVPTPPQSRLNCSVNQSTGGLSVTVDPAGLAPGTFVYPVTVSAPNAAATSTFAVALTVGALPRIALSTRSLHFQAVRGSATTSTQSVTVTNAGGGSLGALTCSAPVTWLTCSASGGTVTVTVNPGTLSASPLPATVSVSAAGAANSPQTLTVTLELQQPIVAVSPGSVTFTSSSGGAVDPQSATVNVLNVGVGTVGNLGAITCTPPLGSPVLCSVGLGQITISLDQDDIVAGVTQYPVSVSAQHSNVTATLVVTVNAEPPPLLGLTQTSVHFTAIRGSISTIPQTVAVVNRGGGELGTVDCPDQPATWLTCSADDNGVYLIANPTGLTASPPAVVVTVTAQSEEGVSQGTSNLTVTLTLEQPVLAVNPTNAQITGTGTVQVQASNIGAGSYVNLGLINCTAPANVQCGVNQGTGVLTITGVPGNLTPGTYIRVVTVTAANASNSQTVTIVLTIAGIP